MFILYRDYQKKVFGNIQKSLSFLHNFIFVVMNSTELNPQMPLKTLRAYNILYKQITHNSGRCIVYIIRQNLPVDMPKS